MILRLDHNSAGDIQHIGGKGMGLLRLIRAGLPVPEAWCIPAGVSLQASTRAACLADALDAWWDQAARAFPGSLWAVRSSAVAEDLEDASFAGVYQTILGVGSKAALHASVEQCWSALDDVRAQAYRSEKGIGKAGGIALILQRMLLPQAAGVMLTANPQRPFAAEIVIDAAWGLGEAVVSGKTQPDHLVLDSASGKIIEQHIGEKSVETVWHDGLEDLPVELARRERLSVDDAGLQALFALAQTVGKAIGPQRDLEWAIEKGQLYALQDRPITGLPSATPTNVWTRKFGDEYMSDYIMPLTRDLMLAWIGDISCREFVGLMGNTELAKQQPLRVHRGYAYYSGDFVAGMLSAWPRGMRAANTPEWFTPLWHERIRALPWKPGLALKMLGATRRDPGRSGIAENLQALARHCGNIDQRIVPRLTQDYAALPADEWCAQYQEIDQLGREHFRVIRWGMSLYNPMLHSMSQSLLRKWAADDNGDLYQAIISGLPGTRTAQINRELWDLAQLAGQDAQLLGGLRQDQGYSALRRAYPAAGFWTEFDGFLQRHGHRSSTREAAYPRWHESPAIILGFVQALLRGTAASSGPRENEERAETRRCQAEQEALTRAGGGVFGSLRRRFLAKVFRRTQEYTVYRENQRYHLDYLGRHQRQLVLEQARRLQARGVLDAVDDVFLLDGRQLLELARGAAIPAGLRECIEERRREYLSNKDRLPATYLFDDVETEGEIVEGAPLAVEAGDGSWKGFGASRGKANGPARVVTDLSQLAGVRAGDILVAANIDPGWTSVFPLIAGLITETGGILSHGAILAREYGVPTVTGLKEATRRLSTGMRVELDGASGAVSVLDDEPLQVTAAAA
ncbi:phosphoenolpyruvate synthase [Solimonas sp. K1W22B-7]|uniref:PEP/pyruvate-binding domain-containing protein n=1 Tax=Solimonas sp. K1W22B-7 TaxID=2303331 RepID=UPI000E330FA1|nr:PEP/pyruvate-binding domain-containing protein [Solimonas sp. K1W22B-7]AXQ31144.1 phosphoenolpyruvate synthase [Solimonas sp. K1W22B-7]